MDIDQGAASIELADGSEHSFPLPMPLARSRAGMKRAVYDTAEHEFAVTLPMGEEVVLEMVGPGAPWPAPMHPVVYLDQLHWIALARCLWAPEKLGEADRGAAARLIELARERKICLPFSAGNLTEMTQMDGRRRRHLATTILELSRGWQMRNPIAIRRGELDAILLGRDPRFADPFTLQAGEVFTEGLKSVDAPADFPPEWSHWFVNITAVSAMVAAMIDDEKISKAEGMEMARRWAMGHQDLALYMRKNKYSKAEVRRGVLAKLTNDLAAEIAAAAEGAGFDQSRLDLWIEKSFEADLVRMPYLGRHHEVIHQRLSNADDRWEANDLTDINYLPCAAGYADVVVAEKKSSEYLKRVRDHAPRGAFVCRRLVEAVAHLEALIDEGTASSP